MHFVCNRLGRWLNVRHPFDVYLCTQFSWCLNNFLSPPDSGSGQCFSNSVEYILIASSVFAQSNCRPIEREWHRYYSRTIRTQSGYYFMIWARFAMAQQDSIHNKSRRFYFYCMCICVTLCILFASISNVARIDSRFVCVCVWVWVHRSIDSRYLRKHLLTPQNKRTISERVTENSRKICVVVIKRISTEKQSKTLDEEKKK